MMNRIKLPIGKSNFEDIRKAGYFYVDKSLLIRELLEREGTDVTLITRPRRFGKTLVMSMLSSFFDISKDSRDIFRGLKISEDEEICRRWMNRYPTVFVSFKNVDGLDFNSASDSLRGVIFNLFCSYSFLLESDRVIPALKRKFSIILEGNPSLSDIKESLALLVRMLSSHYSEKVILLIDEYDVPMAKADSKGYYEEMTDVMRCLLQVLKDNDYLKFSVLTGCLRIAKESIFTGLNNVYCDSVTGLAYDEYFGFTEEEVAGTLNSLGLENRLEEVKEWYDGYHFGNRDVYCPWDVINYISALFENPDAEPEPYWLNTSDNMIIRSFISSGNNRILRSFDTLLSGGYIVRKIDEGVTYDFLHSNEENIWSILLMTGYLTVAGGDTFREYFSSSDVRPLIIPNKGIREIFARDISNWVAEKTKTHDMTALDRAVWKKDTAVISREVSALLMRTISYYDYSEDFYHAFLAGIFTGMGYTVDSNREYGLGRPDVVIHDDSSRTIVIFEVKCTGTAKKRKTTEEAVKQIVKKKYEEAFPDMEIISYGILFSEKSCSVEIK